MTMTPSKDKANVNCVLALTKSEHGALMAIANEQNIALAELVRRALTAQHGIKFRTRIDMHNR